MRERRVLEFIHEDVADPVVEREQQVRGSLVGLQRPRRALRDLREVRLAVHREDHLQLGEGTRQELEDRLERPPLGRRVMGGRQSLDIAQRRAQSLVVGELARGPRAPRSALGEPLVGVRAPGFDVGGRRCGNGLRPARAGARDNGEARTRQCRLHARLREARLPYRAIEIEPLEHRPVVQDLLALAHALPGSASSSSIVARRLRAASA